MIIITSIPIFKMKLRLRNFIILLLLDTCKYFLSQARNKIALLYLPPPKKNNNRKKSLPRSRKMKS